MKRNFLEYSNFLLSDIGPLGSNSCLVIYKRVY